MVLGGAYHAKLCSTFNDLAKSIDDGHTTHALVIDFKKACCKSYKNISAIDIIISTQLDKKFTLRLPANGCPEWSNITQL